MFFTFSCQFPCVFCEVEVSGLSVVLLTVNFAKVAKGFRVSTCRVMIFPRFLSQVNTAFWHFELVLCFRFI